MIHKSKTGLYVIYTRVSTKKQSEGLSFPEQMQVCQGFIESVEGRLLHEPFVETYSAWYATRLKGKKRQKFEAMIELCKETGAGIVFAFDDRFARDVELVAHLLNSGVVIIDALNPHRTREDFLRSSVGNEEWSSKISDRTKRAMAIKKLRGEPLGAQTHKVKLDYKRMRAQRMRLQAWEFLSSEKAMLFAEILMEHDKRFEDKGIFDFDRIKAEKKHAKLFEDKTMNKILRQINKFHLKTLEPDIKNPVKWQRENVMKLLRSYCLHCKTYKIFFGRTPLEEAEKQLDMVYFTEEQYNNWLHNDKIQNRIEANKKKKLEQYEREAEYIRTLGYIPPRKETRGRPRKVVNE